MSGGDAGASLADKLANLFRTVQPLQREYTIEEVARGCTEVGLGTFSKTYVWQLRTGRRDNPTKRHIEALAQFFGVPPAYFFDDEVAARIDAQLELMTAMRDSGVGEVALRLMQLGEVPRKSVVRIVEEIASMYSATRSQA